MEMADAIAAYLASCRARGLAVRTLEAYGWALRPLHGVAWPPQPEAVEYALGVAVVSSETRWDRFRAVRTFLRWAERRLGIPPVAAALDPPLRRRTVMRYLDELEIGRVLEVAKGDDLVWAVVVLLLDTGMRAGELCSLSWGDIRVQSGGGALLRVSGKVGEREVPLSPDGLEALLSLRREPLSHGRVFPLDRNGVYRRVSRVLKKAGIWGRKLGPHTLRHTFGRQYILSGGDVFSLQRILGHARMETTAIYARMDVRDVIAQHGRFSPLRRALAGG